MKIHDLIFFFLLLSSFFLVFPVFPTESKTVKDHFHQFGWLIKLSNWKFDFSQFDFSRKCRYFFSSFHRSDNVFDFRQKCPPIYPKSGVSPKVLPISCPYAADVPCFTDIKRMKDEHIIGTICAYVSVRCPPNRKQDVNSHKSFAELLLNICVNCVRPGKHCATRFIAPNFWLEHVYSSIFRLYWIDNQQLAMLSNESNYGIANIDFYHRYGSMTIKFNLLCIRCGINISFLSVQWLQNQMNRTNGCTLYPQSECVFFLVLTIHLVLRKITFLAPSKIISFAIHKYFVSFRARCSISCQTIPYCELIKTVVAYIHTVLFLNAYFFECVRAFKATLIFRIKSSQHRTHLCTEMLFCSRWWLLIVHILYCAHCSIKQFINLHCMWFDDTGKMKSQFICKI